MSATDLNHRVAHIGHIVDNLYELLDVIHDWCLFNKSDQLTVGKAFNCCGLKGNENVVSVWGKPLSGTFAARSQLY